MINEMNLNDNVNKIVKLAKESNGIIEFIIKGDVNDADYIYKKLQYTPAEFKADKVGRAYKFFKTLVDEVWHSDHEEILQNLNDKDYIAPECKKYWMENLINFVPFSYDMAHTIVDVELRVIVVEV